MSGYQVVTADSAFEFERPQAGDRPVPGGQARDRRRGRGLRRPDQLPGAPLALHQSLPAGQLGWQAAGHEASPTSLAWMVRARAICAVVAP